LGCSFAGNILLQLYSSDAQVIAAGMARLSIICRLYFLCGCMDVMAGCLRGLGYSVMPMVVSLVGSCALRLVWIATVFQLYRSTTTLYLSYPISWALTMLAHLICFFIVRHKLIQKGRKAQQLAKAA
jgi:Na+-driven multidrug efflux pump